MAVHFHKVYTSINLYGYKLIRWEMDGSSFKPTTPVSFYVDKARSGGEWTNIAGPLVDTCYYTDTVPWDWNKEYNTFFRVRFLDGATWIYSTPVQAGNNWDQHDWTIAKEIIRKEYLVMRKVGQQGILLKRRQWGQRCTTCTDYDSRAVVNRDCPLCLGTGILGGYYTPIDMPIWSVTPMQSRTKTVTAGGVLQPSMNNARVVAYPLLETFDVWCDAGSNERWFIDAIKPVAEIKGIPVVEMMDLKLKPFSDVIYTAPANVKANEVPVEQPAGTEHTWSRKLDCLEY